MQTLCIILCCIFSAATVLADCNSNMTASTSNSQLIDNGNGTITDLKTGLMWKQCLEGVSGSSCETGLPDTFTWQQALQQPGLVNNAGGFAGYTDWRLPNVKELVSLVEEQCYTPAINSDRFPNTPSSGVWSGSPYALYADSAWYVNFNYGDSGAYFRNSNYAGRWVRSGQ